MTFPRTLVAVDEPHDAVLLHRAFNQAGFSMAVHFVSDGLEAVDYLRGKQLSNTSASATLPHLLLVDLKMPGLSGFGVLEWLRDHPHLRPARVVVFSASQSPEDISMALALGADHYLIRSSDGCDQGAIIQRLAEILAHARPTRAMWVASDRPGEPTAPGLRLASADR